MPNIKSAKKRLRQSEKRTFRNRAAKSQMKTAIKKVEDSIQKGEEQTVRHALQEAISVINKTAQKGIIHDNKASRLTSSVTRKANARLSSKQESS